SHLAGDDDEALSLREAVTEVRQRLAVGDAAEIECRIGRQLEGLSGKAVEVVEHDVVSGGPSVDCVAKAEQGSCGQYMGQVGAAAPVEPDGRSGRQSADQIAAVG